VRKSNCYRLRFYYGSDLGLLLLRWDHGLRFYSGYVSLGPALPPPPPPLLLPPLPVTTPFPNPQAVCAVPRGTMTACVAVGGYNRTFRRTPVGSLPPCRSRVAAIAYEC